MLDLAIDPGASGGLAWNARGIGICVAPMPDSEAGVVTLLKQILLDGGNHIETTQIRVSMELVTGYVAQRPDEEEERREPGNTMFKFGRGTGVIIGACLAMGVTVEEIAPRTWQKPYCIPKGPKPMRKKYLKAMAQRRFPGVKVTLKTCDALLIREFAVMRAEGVSRYIEPIEQEKPRSEAPVRLEIAFWQGKHRVFSRDRNGGITILRDATAEDQALYGDKNSF